MTVDLTPLPRNPSPAPGADQTAAGGKVSPPAAAEGTPVGAPNPLRAELQAAQRGLRFSVDEETGKTVITVVDRATGEVVRQIPSEELIAIARELRAMAGLLLDDHA